MDRSYATPLPRPPTVSVLLQVNMTPADRAMKTLVAGVRPQWRRIVLATRSAACKSRLRPFPLTVDRLSTLRELSDIRQHRIKRSLRQAQCVNDARVELLTTMEQSCFTYGAEHPK